MTLAAIDRATKGVLFHSRKTGSKDEETRTAVKRQVEE